jgi:hypothetical protein
LLSVETIKIGKLESPKEKYKTWLSINKALCASTILKIVTKMALSIPGFLIQRFGQFFELEEC